MTRLRARIAERLVQAQATAALLTTFNEVDLGAVQELRARYKDAFEKKHGVKLGFMSFFVKAAIEALKRFPVVNAAVEGDDIVYHEYFDIGVAVSTERGLMVPVLRDADALSFAEIEQRIADFAQRARNGSITLEELTGGTFSITNGGIFGSLLSTPIVNPPQSAILGMHKIQERPMVVDGQIVVAADDVSGADLRPPHHRWTRGRAVPGDHQGLPRGSGADCCSASDAHGRFTTMSSSLARARPAIPAAIRAAQNGLKVVCIDALEESRRQRGVRRHLSERRLHSLQGAARVLRTLRPCAAPNSRCTAFRPAG